MTASTVAPGDNGQRPKRRRRSTADLRTDLTQAAVTIFARRGYSGASLQEIADLARTPKMSIYRQYGSKADLFVAAVAEPFLELIEDYTATFKAQMAAGFDTYTLTEALVASLYDHLHEKRLAVLALISASGDPEAEEPVREVTARLEHMFEVFESLSRELADDHPDYPISEARLWHRLVTGMVISATALGPLTLPSGWYEPSRDQLVKMMTHMVTSGIFSPSPDSRSAT
jgi:AcrR family transcriptional regulator